VKPDGHAGDELLALCARSIVSAGAPASTTIPRARDLQWRKSTLGFVQNSWVLLRFYAAGSCS
jgi:hypothetical protein